MPHVTASVPPPAAARRPRVLEQHGVRRTDDYAWLADVNAPAVLEHLAAERRHYEDATADLEPRRQALVAEMRAHLPEEDASVPWRHGDVEYLTRIRRGDDHTRLLRLDADGAEQLVLDGAAVAAGAPYLGYGVVLPTRDGSRVAHSVDLLGEELYELRFRDVTFAYHGSAAPVLTQAAAMGAIVLASAILYFALVFLFGAADPGMLRRALRRRGNAARPTDAAS